MSRFLRSAHLLFYANILHHSKRFTGRGSKIKGPVVDPAIPETFLSSQLKAFMDWLVESALSVYGGGPKVITSWGILSPFSRL